MQRQTILLKLTSADICTLSGVGNIWHLSVPMPITDIECPFVMGIPEAKTTNHGKMDHRICLPSYGILSRGRRMWVEKCMFPSHLIFFRNHTNKWEGLFHFLVVEASWIFIPTSIKVEILILIALFGLEYSTPLLLHEKKKFSDIDSHCGLLCYV